MNQHIRYEATMTEEARDLFAKLCEVAELAHHANIDRVVILEKLAALDRRILNTCHEQLTAMAVKTKTNDHG